MSVAILVDDADNVTGYDNKVNAHRGHGLLHRAFSVFLFNAITLRQPPKLASAA